MTDTESQSALREWRLHMTHPLTLTAIAGVTVILALVGPFGTITSLNTIERLVYWLLLVAGGYATGYSLSLVFLRGAQGRGPHWVRVALAGGSTGLCMAVAVTLLNLVVFGRLPGETEFPAFVATIIAISVVIMAVIDTFSRHLAPRQAAQAQGDVTPPAILERLPLDKRGALIALSVEDHYVRVRTTKGEDMILMRLADAIRETGDTQGDRVHRSHWAAFDQVTGVTRDGDRARLHMTKGADIPVSRRNIPKLKRAGLLPR